MDDIRKVSRELTNILGERATTLQRFAASAKYINALGAAYVAIATFLDWKVSGSVAAVIVLVASAFLLKAEKDTSTSLADARQAMDQAMEQQTELENERRKWNAAEDAYAGELDRLSHLQAAREVIRAIFEEEATSTKPFDEIAIVDEMLLQTRRQLLLAHGFEMSDFYTICVYQRVVNPDTNSAELVCTSHLRSIDCDLKSARKWREGIGAAGIALARREEVIVPDLSAVQLGTLYSLLEKKADDESRYRSIVAEPISADGPKSPLWGVLVATSNRPHHFSMEDRSYVNVTQSLAGMIGLAIKLARSRKSPMSSESHS